MRLMCPCPSTLGIAKHLEGTGKNHQALSMEQISRLNGMLMSKAYTTSESKMLRPPS